MSEGVVEECGTCRYYKRGVCRRYPPDGSAADRQPEVGRHEWCGEWRPAVEAPKETAPSGPCACGWLLPELLAAGRRKGGA